MNVAPAVLRRFHRVRLVVYGILAVSYMLVFFHRVAPAAVAADLLREFHVTAASLGSLAAMYFYVYSVMQIPAGVLADTLGVRRAASAGALIAGLGSILFSVAPDFAAASVGRLLVGLGVSVVFVGLMRANTVWWSERRYGFISGLTVFLGNLGAMLAAAPLAALLLIASWRAVFVVIGVFSVGIALLTFWFVRDRPEDMGFPSVREMEGQTAHTARAQHWRRDLWEVLRNRGVWPGFWANLGMPGCMIAFAGLWGVPLLTDGHGLSRTHASFYTTATLAGFAVGALALGVLSDRIGRRKPVLVLTCFVSVGVWLALLLLPWGPGWSGLSLYTLIGLCAGGFIVTFGAAKEIVAPAIAGMAIALVNTGTFLGAAVVQPVFGLLMDLTWNGAMVDGMRTYRAADYENGLWLCFALAVLAAFAALRLRETYCRNITVREAPAVV